MSIGAAVTTLALVVGAFVAGSGAATAAVASQVSGDASAFTSAAPAVTIERVATVRAPAGKRGGVLSPYVGCTNRGVDPHVTWTLTNLETSKAWTYRWKVSAPGVAFPPVPVGKYSSHTEARCRGVATSRTQTLRVKEKTKSQTVSRAEWRRIHRGMTRKQVRHAIGYAGRDASRWHGTTSVTYDMMAFWRWSIVDYRDGRVVAKHWNVDHD